MSEESLWKWKIICQNDIRKTLCAVVDNYVDEYNKKHKVYELELQRYNDMVQANFI